MLSALRHLYGRATTDLSVVQALSPTTDDAHARGVDRLLELADDFAAARKMLELSQAAPDGPGGAAEVLPSSLSAPEMES